MQCPSGNGLSKGAVTDPVSLKVLSWNMAGQSEDSTDIFLSQISMLTDGDVLTESWITRKRDWRLDDFALAAICCADDVVLVAVSMSAAEIMVTEVAGEDDGSRSLRRG